jgi:hypothetical protein
LGWRGIIKADNIGIATVKLKDIETVITQLSDEELAELTGWFHEYSGKVLDKRIERDLQAGRLDAVLDKVDREYKAGLGQPL